MMEIAVHVMEERVVVRPPGTRAWIKAKSIGPCLLLHPYSVLLLHDKGARFRLTRDKALKAEYQSRCSLAGVTGCSRCFGYGSTLWLW